MYISKKDSFIYKMIWHFGLRIEDLGPVILEGEVQNETHDLNKTLDIFATQDQWYC